MDAAVGSGLAPLAEDVGHLVDFGAVEATYTDRSCKGHDVFLHVLIEIVDFLLEQVSCAPVRGWRRLLGSAHL